MRGTVFVDNEQNYKNWLNEQETFSDVMAKFEQIKLDVNKKLAKK
jgi:heme/copper-type cytochrome/quinol oxidase subunit 2